MPKVISIIFFIVLSFVAFGEADSTSTVLAQPDTTILETVLEHDSAGMISGWHVLPVPFPGYSSDYGFIIGVFLPILNYGKNPSLYPEYIEQFEMTLRYSTNKSGVVRFFYDSEHLIPKLRTTVDLTFIIDKRFPFYGYNGYETPYNDLRTLSFYSYSRQFLRTTIDIQGEIWKKLQWVGGLSFFYLNTESSNMLGTSISNEPTLYDIYCRAGVISPEEKRGGKHAYFRGGFFYDSRDFERAPSKGMATELTVAVSPDIIDSRGFTHGKISFIHRQFFPLYKNKIVLAYRVCYQGTLFGNVPFYMQQNIHTIFQSKTYSDGVGGDASIRGILPQRVLGDGMFWANIEPRFRLVDFRLFKQNFYLGANPFFDMGMVTQKYKEEELQEAQDASSSFQFLSGDNERMHKTLGLGLKLGMNENFILTLEFGFALDNRDGDYGIYAGTNFSF